MLLERFIDRFPPETCVRNPMTRRGRLPLKVLLDPESIHDYIRQGASTILRSRIAKLERSGRVAMETKNGLTMLRRTAIGTAWLNKESRPR